MRTITITLAAPGETLTGRLPESWAEVPLSPYAQLATAGSVRARIAATAAICSLPAAPLLEDTGLFGVIVRAAPWLFRGPLPDELPRQALIAHEGTAYAFAGDLHKISAGQLEALLGFLSQHADAPLLAAPAILAVLYCPVGEAQTADVVERTTDAFARLPVAVAWPALLDFLRSGANAALHIRNSSALLAATHTLLAELETSLTATGGGSSTSSQRLRRWLIRTWIRYAKRRL